jgi:hypothetical protein
MEPDHSQRRQLGDFLRARREALPAPATGRRRTPGWRREEVAAAANVSTTWYVWAEQGRGISLSPQALARLAVALHLTPAERAYLFALAARLDPDPPHEPGGQPLPEDLRALPGAIATPAYILDPLYNGHGWNEPASALFSPWLESGEPNLLRFVFQQAAARDFIAGWQARAQRLVAEFRAETVHEAAAPARQALIESLTRESTDFARFWQSHTVLAREGGARSFLHPQRGVLRYVQHNLIPAAHPGYRLVILTAA